MNAFGRWMMSMGYPVILICLTVTLSDDYVNEEDSGEPNVRSNEVTLIDIQNVIRSSLENCMANWDGKDSLESIYHNRLLRNYWEIALRTASERYPESVKCLKRVQPLLQKHEKLLMAVEKRNLDEEDENTDGIDAFLNQNQLQQLRYLHKHGDSDVVEQALDQYFEGLPSHRKAALIHEFLRYDPRRVQRDIVAAEQRIDEDEEDTLEPEELEPEWLAWQTSRQRNLISQMIIGKASKWDVMNEIGDQFYHLRKEVRALYKKNLQNYCIRNVKNVIGESKFNVIRGMYLDTDPIDQIETKFNELVSELPEERQRLLADHYAVFCRKIFRLVNFEPTDLTTWLTSSQKMALGQMIRDPNVNDTQIYDKIYEFYKNATGEQKEEATDIIESGCRHFIAHMFGDDNAEELEELREAGVVSKQYLAAKLATHISEVSSAVDRKRAESSLPVCSRIYLGYDGSCECNGHSSICDSLRHHCLNCTGNTYGIQCEMCMESFTGDPLSGGECFPIEAEETSCHCNNHSDICDTEGKCQLCMHNTAGDHCERCAAGYYGDATNGSREDCTRCPCPDGGDCFVNEQELVQCRECPNGTHGITCEEDGVTPKDLQKEIEEVKKKEEEENEEKHEKEENQENEENEEKEERPKYSNGSDHHMGNNRSHINSMNQTIIEDNDGRLDKDT